MSIEGSTSGSDEHRRTRPHPKGRLTARPSPPSPGALARARGPCPSCRRGPLPRDRSSSAARHWYDAR